MLIQQRRLALAHPPRVRLGSAPLVFDREALHAIAQLQPKLY